MALTLPGFVDLQVNGHLSISFSDPELTEDDFCRVSRELLAAGTVAFLPTVITSSAALYERNLPLIVRCLRREEFRGRLLGLHIEGPFISPVPGAVGAHPPEHVRAPDPALLTKILDWADGEVRMLTVAACQPGAVDLIRQARARGVTVSLGHQLTLEDQLEAAADAGATCLTHLGNGLPNELPRLRNPIYAGIANERLTAMVIADGHHLPESVLKTIIRAKGVDKVAVVSDASSLAGMPPGRYHALSNDVVLEENGLLHNPVKKCMVGSSFTMFKCMNHLAKLGWWTPGEMVRLGFDNPLALIGRGPADLRPGKGQVKWDGTSKRWVLAA